MTFGELEQFDVFMGADEGHKEHYGKKYVNLEPTIYTENCMELLDGSCTEFEGGEEVKFIGIPLVRRSDTGRLFTFDGTPFERAYMDGEAERTARTITDHARGLA